MTSPLSNRLYYDKIKYLIQTKIYGFYHIESELTLVKLVNPS